MITVRPMRLLPRSPPLDVTEVLLLVVVFAVPVAVVPWASNAFELPKAALLCFLVLILAALGLGQFLITDPPSAGCAGAPDGATLCSGPLWPSASRSCSPRSSQPTFWSACRGSPSVSRVC